jgi:class 3 adenylate cyclase/pimeloyl-ACP methyl ester carboxylesterase
VDDSRVRYAKSGDTRIAYRVWGSEGPTLVRVLGWVTGGLDDFTDPANPYSQIRELFSPHFRDVGWDRPGSGLSDPLTHIPSLDERVGDLHAVLDAADVERAVLWAAGEGGPVSVQFAVTYPERVASLMLFVTAARFSQHLPDHPWGFTQADIDRQLEDIDNNWGEGALAELFLGAAAELPGVREDYGRRQRAVSSPTMARLLWQETMQVDVRSVLDQVRTPTLVLARPDDPYVPFEAAAALAAGIPGAQFRALPPGPHNCFDIGDVLVAETLEFVCNKTTSSTPDRVLATVLFTDIVGSTEMLSTQGDARWRQQLGVHDKIVDVLLDKYGGRRAKHTGDGVFAIFDAPTRACQFGLELSTALATRGFRIRVGVHAGECERRGDDWSGLAVHIGARISAMAESGEVLASRTVRELSVGSGLVFDDLGAHRLKGLNEDVNVYRVHGR